MLRERGSGLRVGGWGAFPDRESTVNSPIQYSYHLPHPDQATHRPSDVPCLTGKLNRYFTVSYPHSHLHGSSCPAAEGWQGIFLPSNRTCENGWKLSSISLCVCVSIILCLCMHPHKHTSLYTTYVSRFAYISKFVYVSLSISPYPGKGLCVRVNNTPCTHETHTPISKHTCMHNHIYLQICIYISLDRHLALKLVEF